MTLLHSLVWLIALAAILGMLVRPRGLAEVYPVGAGAALLVGAHLIPVQRAFAAIGEGTDVYLFLTGMMLLSELARLEGVFDWIAELAARRSGGSPGRLFLLVYLAGVAVTALLSNDATAVVLTPAVLAVVRRARVAPEPYLLACALIANAASFLLPISNPANLVIFGRNLPDLGDWLRIFFLPSLAAIGVTYVLLRILCREQLTGMAPSTAIPPELSPKGRLALGGLGLAACTLLGASALGRPLGMPTLISALLVFTLVAAVDQTAPLKAVREVAWSVLPLVASLFVIVAALEGAGLPGLASQALAALGHCSPRLGHLGAGFGVGLLSNGMNNLPVGLASAGALHTPGAAGYANALLIGVDLGPNLSVTGSLATILWLIALRRGGVEFSAKQFLKVGVVVMPPALLVSLLLLRP